jgi:NifU-like domain
LEAAVGGCGLFCWPKEEIEDVKLVEVVGSAPSSRFALQFQIVLYQKMQFMSSKECFVLNFELLTSLHCSFVHASRKTSEGHTNKTILTMTTTTTARSWWTAMAVAVTIASFISVVPVDSYVPLLSSVAVSFRKRGAAIIVTTTAKTSRTIFARLGPLAVSTEESSASSSSLPSPPPPILNGKRVFPVQVLMTGLKGHENRKIPAVYALLNQQYKRGSEGWENVVHVGVSQDFYTSIKSIMETNKKDVFHVRALSFSFPEPISMQEIANQWKQTALDADAKFNTGIVDASLYLHDDDDDEDDEDDDDWAFEMTSQAMATAAAATTTISNSRLREQQLANDDDSKNVIVSPFAANSDSDDVAVELLSMRTSIPAVTTTAAATAKEFTRDSVDIVLNEIRPYLISDGGNATVESVDKSTKTVSLKLLGACGTCPSSTGKFSFVG